LATVAAIGSILVPAMLNEGYPLNFSLATVASAGWIGVIIPPSIPMILYATSGGGISVGDLFLGGFIPGIILAAAMSLYAFYYGKRYMKNARKFSFQEVRASFTDAIWALGMPLIILGGIYGGIFTPTEAAAVACAYGIFVGFVLYKELSIKIFREILNNSVISTAFIMFVVAAATAFGYVMTMEKIPTKVANYIVSVASGRGSFLVLVTILLLIVGTFMDTAPAVLILSPILVPVLSTYGIDPVAFGVILVINLGIGMVTPPVGMNLYVAASLRKVPVTTVINKHLFFYMTIAFLIMVVYMIFPDIILLLPRLLMKK
jgi:C4-dicarboxylate transporter DctM subunit